MLTVKDIMQTDVVTVTTDTTARHLARILSDQEISGVPVLDASDSLVGVVSATDLVRLAADETGFEMSPAGVGKDPISDPEADDEDLGDGGDLYGFFLPESRPVDGRRLLDGMPDSEFDTMPVADIMTPVSFSVRPDTPVTELCEFLVRGRIHRAVVAEGEDLVGIVTSADVLKAVADGRLSS